MSEIVHIPFHGDDLPVTLIGNRPHIVLKPAIEAVGLDYPTQYTKLQGRSWATVGQSPMVAEDGKNRVMVTVDVRTFLMLLATVDENRVAEEVRPKLIAYQSEVADAIEAYFTRGGAINPQATADQLIGLANRIEAQARVLQAVRGLVDPAWLEAKARVLTARALGEAPEIEPADHPLTVSDYLEDRGISGQTLRSVSPRFGKRLKAQYVVTHGREPGKTERFVDGAMREVFGYTESHRTLFDTVYTAMFGKES